MAILAVLPGLRDLSGPGLPRQLGYGGVRSLSGPLEHGGPHRPSQPLCRLGGEDLPHHAGLPPVDDLPRRVHGLLDDIGTHQLPPVHDGGHGVDQLQRRDGQPLANGDVGGDKAAPLLGEGQGATKNVASKGEFNEFDLNTFFSTEGKNKEAVFKYEDEVQKWLNLIRGQFSGNIESDLKLGRSKNFMPFSNVKLLEILQHTFWFLPNVASCYAMANLLGKAQNNFFHDYDIVVCAGEKAGIGVEALKPVKKAMGDPLKTKTIVLSCGKLTTGVSVPPWSGILMLRNTSSPETYFQSIFRVQTPWVIKNPNGDNPNQQEIIKNECYVFDFDVNRALKQVASYAYSLNVNPNASPEEKVTELISFLPVLAYDGSRMNASDVLDLATSGTSATLLARKWESALLVNVDNVTLQRLLNNEEALKILERIEGFRSLSRDIETIINKSEKVKKTKKEFSEAGVEMDTKTKKEITEEEKEYKSKRKQIQEKLIKFATRIPVFMYLSEHREQTLRDVITKLEPELFKKVTGIEVKDFELLQNLGLFNSVMMNDAVLKFKYYEDASLAYTGKATYEGLRFIGAFDTVVPVKEYVEE